MHAFAGGHEATGKLRISALLTFNLSLVSLYRCFLCFDAWLWVDIFTFRAVSCRLITHHHHHHHHHPQISSQRKS